VLQSSKRSLSSRNLFAVRATTEEVGVPVENLTALMVSFAELLSSLEPTGMDNDMLCD